VFALSAASVHSTYPGTNATYTAGGPVMLIGQTGFFGPLLYPNGTIERTGEIFWGVRNKALNMRLINAAKFGPTLFPILFAGIVGNAIRLVARWKAERSSTIEVQTFPFIRVNNGLTLKHQDFRDARRKQIVGQHGVNYVLS
jgi:hypothetical protein